MKSEFDIVNDLCGASVCTGHVDALVRPYVEGIYPANCRRISFPSRCVSPKNF
jgi:hypothetical protein